MVCVQSRPVLDKMGRFLRQNRRHSRVYTPRESKVGPARRGRRVGVQRERMATVMAGSIDGRWISSEGQRSLRPLPVASQ